MVPSWRARVTVVQNHNLVAVAAPAAHFWAMIYMILSCTCAEEAAHWICAASVAMSAAARSIESSTYHDLGMRGACARILGAMPRTRDV